MKKICKNCRLYDEKNSACSVIIWHGGEKLQINVKPEDSCHWERLEREINEQIIEESAHCKEKSNKIKLLEQTETPIAIKQIRAWSDGENGYIEYDQ